MFTLGSSRGRGSYVTSIVIILDDALVEFEAKHSLYLTFKILVTYTTMLWVS